MGRGTKGFGKASRQAAGGTATPRTQTEPGATEANNGAESGDALSDDGQSTAAATVTAPAAFQQQSAGATATPAAASGNGAVSGAGAVGTAAGQQTSPARQADQPLGRTQENGAVYYDKREMWRDEFQTRRGEKVHLRDGEDVWVGSRYDDPIFYVPEGKQRDYATGSYYMSAGLDSIESVETDPDNPSRLYVTASDGTVASYDYETNLAADESGLKEKTAAQMGAVMAGTRQQINDQDPRSPLEQQYADAYDAYQADPSVNNNIRATDAFYALKKDEDRSPGFSHDGSVANLADHRHRKEAEREAAAQQAATKQAAATELGPDHQKLAGLMGVARISDADNRFTDAENAYVPEPDPSFVMAKSHEEVASDIGAARSLGFRSFAVLGEPGTGKNFLLEQASAVEGRPHLELDVDETTEVSELFGASTMKDGNIVFKEGKVTSALKNGHRVVLNEANTAPVEVMTVFHNVVGSGNSAESRFVTIKSPEAGETRVPVHPDAEIIFTYNPEGTGREGGLGRALADRVTHFPMRKLSPDEGASVVASQANKFLTKAGKQTIDKSAAKKDMGFFEDLRRAYRDNQPGITKEPDSRWLHRFSAFRQLGGRDMALRRCEEFLDCSSAGEGEAEQMRQTVRDLYERWFGRS